MNLSKEHEELSDKIVDMEPYKVKNIKKFYFRDHPKQLSPASPKYNKYWLDFARSSIEGKWIDDEGTWYWIPPKSFFYINYLTLEDKKRNAINPHYRDIDRIIGRYITCCDGFSGFEGDDKYTCNVYVKKHNEGNLRAVELKYLTESCYSKTTGELKTYIDSWEYLMHHYLIDEPCTSPMGLAMWENPLQNMMILSGRGVGKSVSVFVGDFLHEWLFCGVKRYEEYFTDSQRKYLFAMASADSANLNRSVSLIDSNMTRFPGRYRFPLSDGDKIPDYFGPYYKNTIGTWKVGQTVRHVEKDGSGNTTVVGSVAQIRVITPDKTKIVAGDRFRRIYIEEVGFQENIMEVHANSVDSLKLNGERVGSAVYLGTSGDIKAFRQANELFNTPDGYNIFGIENYWSNSNKIGLFIPAYYSERDYSDENHNINIVESFKYIIGERKKARDKKSSMAYAKMVMYNPVEPKEMMRPSGDSILPKQEAQDALNNLETYDVFKKRALVGWPFYDKSLERGVKFKLDLENKLHPITTYSTTNYPNTLGALILYEPPLPNPPKDLYWIVYDPAAQSGTGTSLHSVIVYKYSFSGNDNSLEDTVVGEWLGRLPTLEENWNMVVMIARYFDAKIFPEYNTPGFLDWCSRRKLFNYLQPENMALKKEINPRAKSSAWRKGFRMDARAKGWALNKLRDWLLEVVEEDDNNIPTKRVIDTIYSPRILEEIIYFDPDDGNYDHVSSLLGLMILHNSLNNIPKPEIRDKYSDDDYFYSAAEEIEYVTPYTRRARASILNY